MNIVIGSRGSALALKQTEFVRDQLKLAYPEHSYEIQIIKTKGDRIQHVALDKINDKGLFVKEIEKALLEGRIDLAVHSLKDMPSALTPGLTFAKTVLAADHRDCLVLREAKTLAQLPAGSVIATGSKRRKYQLLALRPDLKIVGIRGNVNTRLEKMEQQELDGLVLASAGLIRLGMTDRISEYLSETKMIPACGQGILALQVRKNSPLLEMLEVIQDPQASQRMELESLFLAAVNGGCHIPVGSYANISLNQVHFYALLGNEDGSQLERREFICTPEQARERVLETAEELRTCLYER